MDLIFEEQNLPRKQIKCDTLTFATKQCELWFRIPLVGTTQGGIWVTLQNEEISSLRFIGEYQLRVRVPIIKLPWIVLSKIEIPRLSKSAIDSIT